MKDVTSTSFGLLIAFVLPGVAALYVGSFWSNNLKRTFAAFLTAESSIGLFFMVALAALVVSLQVTLIRWLFFEKWFNPEGLNVSDFAALKSQQTLSAFRAAVDEHYRYHQFWGGMAVIIPFATLTVAMQSTMSARSIASVAGLVAIEVLTWIAAREALRHYFARARAILGGDNAERMGQARKEEDQEGGDTRGEADRDSGKRGQEVDQAEDSNS